MWTPFRRLFRYTMPFAWLLGVGILLTIVSALFDTFSLLLLIPFLQSVFGIEIVVRAPRIVKDREQLHHCRIRLGLR